jgi:hypothetical protein
VKKKTTASELLARLNADPAWVAARRAEDEERGRRAGEWRRAEAPLVAELRAAGFEVESAWDLVNTSTPYPRALPILLRHLPRDYPDAVREGIARALATPVAHFGWPIFVELFRKEVSKRAKDGLAVAITANADDSVIGELIELASDPKHGSSRVLLLRALERSKDPRARAALERLASDSDVAKEVAVILKRLGKAKT